MKYKVLYTAVLAALLAACGGSSSSDSDDVVQEPQTVTKENISQAVSVEGASTTTVNAQQIPSDLQPVSSASVDSVVVTANSNFKTTLAVPASSIPEGKKVAGYLIEISADNFLFVPVTTSTVQTAGFSKNLASTDDSVVSIKKAKKTKSGFKITKSLPNKSVSAFVADPIEGETEISFSGWTNSDFNLTNNIDDLKLRIFPLLVNNTVAQVLSIDDIDLADESNWVGVQELLLSVKAVATATIQVSLTWDSKTDIDLWIIDEKGEKLFYGKPLSSNSLGWLDYDNVIEYGPENITFDYQMPVGDYKIYVHHFDGGVETNYQVTVAVGDKVETISGNFAEGVTDSEALDGEGVDFIRTINVDTALKNKLKTPELLSQNVGVWKLPENSSIPGYIKVSDNNIEIYAVDSDNLCNGYMVYTGTYFPTGFSTVDNELKVSDAMLGTYYFEESYDTPASFSYSLLDLDLSTLPDNCRLYVYDEEYE